MDIQGLKDKILQLAIQGKLVAQDPNDEPASMLLERIKKEKDKLIKEGKIKKQKPLPKITEEEKPFEIPESWEWVRLGEVSDIRRGASPRPIKNYQTTDTEGVNWIKIGDATGSNKYITSAKEKITREGAKKSVYLKCGTLIMSNSMSFGKAYILKIDGCIHDGWLAFQFNEDYIDVELLYIFLNASYERFNKLAVGTGVRNLNIDRVRSTIIPLPPLEEQKRIVAKVDELFALIDELDSNKEELLEVINLTRNQVLQLAIQGKLVAQDPNDEPASVLLAKIKEERDKLVKEKKIKKQKPLPEVTEEEKPFEIPEGWEWVRLGEVALVNMGQSPKGDSVSDNEGIEFHQGKIFFGDKYLKKSDKFTTDPKKIALPGDILLSVRAPVGSINITDREVCIGRGLCAISSLRNIPNDYYFYICKAFEDYLIERATGTTFLAVTASTVNEMIIPLPPLAEQKRIVEKVDIIMYMLDELENELTTKI